MEDFEEFVKLLIKKYEEAIDRKDYNAVKTYEREIKKSRTLQAISTLAERFKNNNKIVR